MDITNIVVRMGCSANLRQRLLREFPGLLDNYYISADGEITHEPTMSLKTPKFFLDNLAGLTVKTSL